MPLKEFIGNTPLGTSRKQYGHKLKDSGKKNKCQFHTIHAFMQYE